MSESILYIETPNGETYGVGPTKVSQLENDSGFTTFDDLNNNPRVTNAITSWLDENLTGDSSIVIDSSLTTANAAADAKAVGDRIKALEDATIETDTSLTISGAAADAAAVGTQLNTFSSDGTTEVRPAGSTGLFIRSSDTTLQPGGKDDCRTAYFPCLPNTQYSVKKSISSAAFTVGWTVEFPATGVAVNSYIRDLSATSIDITTGMNAAYVVVYYTYNDTSPENIYNSIRLRGLVNMTLKQKIKSIETNIEDLEAETDSRLDTLENAQIETDDTLTVAGAAADAEAVGLILGTAEYDLSDSERWEQGAYIRGVPSESTIRIRMKGYLPASVNRVSVSSPYSALLYAYGKDGSYIGYWDDGEGGYTQSTNGTFKNELEIPDDGYLHTLILKNGSNQTIDTSAASAVTAETGGRLMQRVAELEGREAGLPSNFKTAMYDLLSHMTGTFSDGNGAAYLDAVIRSMGFDPGGLPAAYQKVSYIEATGTQFISTNIIPHMLPIRVEIGYYRANAPSAEEGIVTLKKTNEDSSVLQIGTTSIGFFAFSGASAFISNSTFSVFGRKLDAVATFKSASPYKVLEVDAAGESYRRESTSANNSILGNGGDYLNIFTIDYDKKLSPISPATGRLYYLRIYEDDTLFADFVPCYQKSSGLVGLYEMVSRHFYTSLGSNFLKGVDVND